MSGLRSLRHPETSAPLITGLRRRDEVLHGPYLERAADILFHIQDYLYQSSVRLGLESPGLLGASEYEDSGSHRPEGILVMAGPGIQPGAGLADATVADILPTLLALAGLPLPAGLDGRPLVEALAPDIKDQLRARAADDPVLEAAAQFSETGTKAARLAGEQVVERPVSEQAAGNSGAASPAEPELTAEELAQLEERLRNLGYLG